MIKGANDMKRIKYTYKCCGKEYFSYKEKSNYCSRECRIKDNTYYHECKYCKRMFRVVKSVHEKYIQDGSKGVFCSKECADKAQITKVKKICEECGKEYFIVNYFADTQKYCSRECYNIVRAKKVKFEIKLCPICNKQFQTYHHNQIYCGSGCAAISLQKRKDCVCDNCGKTFKRIVSEIDKNNTHFCSKDCRYEFFRWSEKDICVLKAYYNKIKNKDIQQMLSKEYSIKAIRSKARVLGLGKSRAWSKSETNILIENYSKISMNELMTLLPNRTMSAILRQARNYNLYSYFFINKVYSSDEIKYLTDNYLEKTNEELSSYLNRTPYGISQKLANLGLFRPCETQKDGYKRLNDFVRSRLYKWKNEVRELNNNSCCLTGAKSNIVVHHCRGFNLLIQETIDSLNFEIKDTFLDYTENELKEFVEEFLNLQAYYGEYVCITEDIHKLFHGEYGYGDNTMEQWNEFVEKFNNGYYINIA